MTRVVLLCVSIGILSACRSAHPQIAGFLPISEVPAPNWLPADTAELIVYESEVLVASLNSSGRHGKAVSTDDDPRLDVQFVLVRYRQGRHSRAVLIGRTEVTERIYFARSSRSGSGTSTQPMTGVTWNEADRFARAFNLTLPTSEQWEFCAVAARRRPVTGHFANIRVDDFDAPNLQPAQVAARPADDFGLFDMIGNASEWCSDGDALVRRVKGGSAASLAQYTRQDTNVGYIACLGTSCLGFRLALPIDW